MKNFLLLLSTLFRSASSYSCSWKGWLGKCVIRWGTIGAFLFVSAQAAQALVPEPTQPPCELQADALKKIDDSCGGTGPTGPTRAPTTPTSITYFPYTNADSLTIQWSTSSGFGFPVSYDLQQSINGGSYKTVYSGGGTQVTLKNLAKAKYTYRVLAKNSAFSSSYKSGRIMAVNPRINYNLYQKYPFFTNLDQIAAASHAHAPSFPTVIARVGGPSQTSTNARTEGAPAQRFYLGDGYDLIRGALKETCLDVNNPDFQIVQNTPTDPTVFEVTYVNDNRHLAKLLDVSESMTAGFVYDDISAGFQGERERYVKSVTDENHVRFVVKIKNRRQFWKLNTPTDAIIPDLTSRVLSPNSDEAKADFRERCGDNFINSANLGTALYLVFDFDAKKYSKEERETKKGELGLKITQYFSFSGAASSSSSFQQYLDNLDVSIFASQVGGIVGLSSTINTGNVLDKYNEFVKNNDVSLWAAVDLTTSDYQRPTVYNAYTHEQIFAKYTGTQGPLAQMKRWLDITVQNKARCSSWVDYGKVEPDSCGTAVMELSIAMDTCRETREWANCVHPSLYYAGSLSTTPGTRLYDWLNANSLKLAEESKSEYYNHHTYKDALQVNDQTCLSATNCFANKFKGNVIGGATVTTYYYDNPKGSGPTYRTTAPENCVTSSVELRPKKPFLGLTDTTADWRYTMVFEGLCPKAQNFELIP